MRTEAKYSRCKRWITATLLLLLPALAPAQPGTFALTGLMTTPRYDATGTELADGRVLVAGGWCCAGNTGTQASAEIYDPSTGTWSATGSMSTPRAGGASATRLQNGRVLIAGGANGGTVVPTAEIYDPSTGMFSPTGSMTT